MVESWPGAQDLVGPSASAILSVVSASRASVSASVKAAVSGAAAHAAAVGASASAGSGSEVRTQCEGSPPSDLLCGLVSDIVGRSEGPSGGQLQGLSEGQFGGQSEGRFGGQSGWAALDCCREVRVVRMMGLYLRLSSSVRMASLPKLLMAATWPQDSQL